MTGVFLLATVLLASIATAQTSSTTAPSDSSMMAAENKMLRVQLARQKALIAELRSEIASMHGTADAPAPISGEAADGVARGQGSRIVFAIEMRGTMAKQFPRVRDELLKAIGNLRRGQEFTILATADRRVLSLAPTTLPATAKNLERARNFLDGLAASAEGDRIHDLIHAACGFDPQTVWLTTCNYDQRDEAEVERSLAARGDYSFRINTLFLPLDTSDSNPGILAEIASRTGGSCVDLNGKVLVPAGPTSKPIPHGPSALDGK